MFTILLLILALAAALDIFFSAAVIYHLKKYALPGQKTAKIVIPSYIALALVFLGLALYSLLLIHN